MAGDKRKGKQIAPQETRKKRKKTAAEREAALAQAVADAADRAEAGGVGGSVQRGGPRRSSRDRRPAAPQPTTVTPQSSTRVRTRGGATPQDLGGCPRAPQSVNPSVGELGREVESEQEGEQQDTRHAGPHRVTGEAGVQL